MGKPDPKIKRSKEEQAFLDAYDASSFERPSVTVDVVILTLRAGLEVLLTKRKAHPFKDRWGLPGGFVGMAESLDQAAERVLQSKGGLGGVFLEQLYTFGDPERDPRTRVITVAYYALVEPSRLGRIAEDSRLFPLAEAKSLAFDHAEILRTALGRIRGKLEYAPLGFELLPERFTLRQLQAVHEAVLGKKLNKDSFRRKMLASGQLQATGQTETGTDFRPAELYRYRR